MCYIILLFVATVGMKYLENMTVQRPLRKAPRATACPGHQTTWERKRRLSHALQAPQQGLTSPCFVRGGLSAPDLAGRMLLVWRLLSTRGESTSTHLPGPRREIGSASTFADGLLLGLADVGFCSCSGLFLRPELALVSLRGPAGVDTSQQAVVPPNDSCGSWKFQAASARDTWKS